LSLYVQLGAHLLADLKTEPILYKVKHFFSQPIDLRLLQFLSWIVLSTVKRLFSKTF
jgi:hypothetical protein